MRALSYLSDARSTVNRMTADAHARTVKEDLHDYNQSADEWSAYRERLETAAEEAERRYGGRGA